MNNLHLIALITSSLVLSACGEPLDGQKENNNGVNASAEEEPTPVPIDEDNYKRIAHSGIWTTSNSRSTPNSFEHITPLASLLSEVTERSCDLSGSSSYVLNASEKTKPLETAGDSFTAEFDECSDLHAFKSGTYSIETMFADESSSTIKYNMDTLVAVGYTNGYKITHTTGDALVTHSGISFTLASEELTVKSTGHSFTVNNLRIQENSLADGSILSTVSGTYIDPILGGTFEVSTQTPLETTLLGDHPHFGVLRFTGAANTYVELNADTGNSLTVQVTLYDGSSTSSETVEWAELQMAW